MNCSSKQRIIEEENALLKEAEYEDIRNAREAAKAQEKLDHLVGKMAFWLFIINLKNEIR